MIVAAGGLQMFFNVLKTFVISQENACVGVSNKDSNTGVFL